VNEKRLTKSSTDFVLAGVCGGLGKYFGIDPVLFRIGFIILTFAGGGGFWIYLILFLIMPEDPNRQQSNLEARAQQVGNRVTQEFSWLRPGLGALIMVFGLWLLLENLGLELPNVMRFWPVIFIFIGTAIIIKAMKR
jgi:phage shock protein C